MRQRLTRRQLLGLVSAVGLASAFSTTTQDRQATALENCYWRKTLGPTCSGGDVVEKRCYVCCAGTSCWTEWCEWRVVGSC